MFYGKSKKVIILRDIHSNLFEEAILVLKEEKDPEQGQKKVTSGKNTTNDFILKEAESVINNYIRDNKGKLAGTDKKKRLAKNPRIKKDLLINFALLGSIAAVIYLIIKLF